MTVQLIDFIKRMSCEDTDFEVIQMTGSHEQVFLCAACTAPDTNDPTKLFTVKRGKMVKAEYTDAEEAAQAVRSLMHYVACHEIDEKLLIDGVAKFHPHDDWTLTENP